MIMNALASLCLAASLVKPCGPVPTQEQLDLQDMEMYAFLHYSLNTYTDQEWGFGNEDPKLFNPSSLDVRQWVKTCKDSGMKGIIFTAKHHCGFCMWPSKFTGYSVKNSPWKDGKGDVVKELAEACREAGLKFGIYLSPWDRNHPAYGKPEYVTYFRNQLEELLTDYGDIYEVWFDGANGGNGWYGGENGWRQIDRLSYYQWEGTYELIRRLQPHCVIWNDGANLRGDIRWVGTEAGSIGHRNWSLMSDSVDPQFAELHFGMENGDKWVPGEVNTSIRPGWFYHGHEDGAVKSLARLMETYYKSVGRNSTLLLNFPIMPNGLISPVDVARGAVFAKTIEQTFADDLAARAVRTDDGNVHTLAFADPTTFNRFMVCEDIRYGQRVKKFSLEAQVDGKWVKLRDELVKPWEGDGLETIGRKRIICFPDVTATALRLTVLDTKAEPILSRIAVFRAPPLVQDKAATGDRHVADMEVITLQLNPPVFQIGIGDEKEIKGFRYYPKDSVDKKGILTTYSLWAMVKGKWVKLAAGEFPNIRNNPIPQTIAFEPVRTSLLRLVAETLAAGTTPTYDDLEVIAE